MSDKIKPQHVTRKAMLYVRQSSAYQVNHNLESQRLQYAMQDRLHRIETVGKLLIVVANQKLHGVRTVR
jgi:hypothetical protein